MVPIRCGDEVVQAQRKKIIVALVFLVARLEDRLAIIGTDLIGYDAGRSRFRPQVVDEQPGAHATKMRPLSLPYFKQ